MLRVILGQPGLIFGGFDPTQESGQKSLTEEYQSCLVARIREVAAERYFVPENVLAMFDRKKTERDLQVQYQENSIDLTSQQQLLFQTATKVVPALQNLGLRAEDLALAPVIFGSKPKPDPNFTLSYLMSPEARSLIETWCKLNKEGQRYAKTGRVDQRREADMNLSFLERTGICYEVLSSTIMALTHTD